MFSNFVAISGNQLAYSTEMVKVTNGSVQTCPLAKVNYIESRKEFVYKIPLSAVSDTPPGVEDYPLGPILVEVRESLVSEVRFMAANNHYVDSFRETQGLIYTRAIRPDMEVALSAASRITLDPIKMISLAARASTINLSTITSLELDKLQTCLGYANRVLTQVNPEDKKALFKIITFLNEMVDVHVKLYLPNIDLDAPNLTQEEAKKQKRSNGTILR